MPEPEKVELNDEKELLARIAEGDEQAFRLVFDKYSPKLNAYGIRLTQSGVLAEEILQEVFVRIWERKQDLRNINNLEAWLITLARNTGSSMLRRMAHERLIIHRLQTGNTNIQEEEQEEEEEWQRYHQQLYNAVLSLPTQQRKVWVMSRYQGIKQQEIAVELGISIYTVKEYIKKATASLKKALVKFIFWGIPSFFTAICLLL